MADSQDEDFIMPTLALLVSYSHIVICCYHETSAAGSLSFVLMTHVVSVTVFSLPPQPCHSQD